MAGNPVHPPELPSTWINPLCFRALWAVSAPPDCSPQALEITADSLYEGDILVSTNAKDMHLPVIALNILTISSTLTQTKGTPFYECYGMIIFHPVYHTFFICPPTGGHFINSIS